jgi:hypothetical protein
MHAAKGEGSGEPPLLFDKLKIFTMNTSLKFAFEGMC